MLVLFTVVTGIVDATSILRLGHVFVANITGSIIFVGIALAGAKGFSVPAPLLALAAFVGGAVVGGLLVGSPVPHRARALRTAAFVQLADMTACTGVVAATGDHPSSAIRYLLIVLLASGMGAKSSIVRRVGVPGLTTSVFTTTLAELASDGPAGGWKDTKFRVRVLAAFALFAGAVAGALLVLNTALWCPVGAASVVLLATAWWTNRASAVTAPWTTLGARP